MRKFWLALILLLFACAPESSGVSLQLNGTQWVLSESGEPIIAQTTLLFQDFQFRANAGCNEINGIYNVDGERLILHNMAKTEMACSVADGGDVMAYEAAFVRWLGSAETFQQSAEQLIINTPTQQLIFVPLHEAVNDQAFTIQVENANAVSDLAVQLLNGTTNEMLAEFPVSNGVATVPFDNMADGHYEIKLIAPTSYFRDPLAYGFQMRNGFPFDVPALDLTFVLDETRIPCEPSEKKEPYPTVAPYPTESLDATTVHADALCEYEVTRHISNVPTRSSLVAVGCSEGGMGVHTSADLRCYLAQFGQQYVDHLSDEIAVLYTVENGFADWGAGAIIYHIPSVSALHVGFCGDPDPYLTHFETPEAATQLLNLWEDAAQMEQIRQRVLDEWSEYTNCPTYGGYRFAPDSIQAIYFAGDTPLLDVNGETGKQILIVNNMDTLRETLGGTIQVLWIDTTQLNAIDPAWLNSVIDEQIPVALIGETSSSHLYCYLARFPATVTCPPSETDLVEGFAVWRAWSSQGEADAVLGRLFPKPPTVEQLFITTLPLRQKR